MRHNQTLLSQTIYYWQAIFLLTLTSSHPSMIPLHCLWAKSKTTEGVINLNVTCGCLFRGGSFEVGRSGSSGWKKFGCRWTGRGESWKLDNFHECRMCIIHYKKIGFLFLFWRVAGKKRTENASYSYSQLFMNSKSTKLHFIKENLFAEKRNTSFFPIMVFFVPTTRQRASFRAVSCSSKILDKYLSLYQ